MHLTPTRCATTAIAAALALGSTGLLAQAAIPDPGAVVVQSPPPAPVQAIPAVPAPQPSIVPPGDDILSGVAPRTVTPGTIPVPADAAPVEAPEPAANETRRTAASPAATRRTTAAPAPDTETTQITPEEATTTAEPFAPEVETVFVPPVALDADEAADAQAAARPDLLDLAGYAIALLAFMALIAFMIRRPRKPKRHVAQPAQTVQPVRRAPEPVAPTVTAAPSQPFAAPTLAPAAVTPHYVPTVAPMATYRREPTVAGRGAAVALPRRVPEDYEERDALLKRMIAAKPDKANPFKSHKARAHRARLILQSIGHHFNDRDPWIDLSGYPEIWPEVANRRFPHAA